MRLMPQNSKSEARGPADGGADQTNPYDCQGGSGRLVHVPIEPLRASLALLQRLVGPALPLTAGQLASFANDGTAAPHPWVEPFIPQMQSIDAMLRESLRGG